MIKQPKNQTMEALYLLIHYNNMSRADFFKRSHILNAPACIMALRKKGIDISMKDISTVNRFGRPIKYGVYTLVDRKTAIKQYNYFNRGNK